MSPAIAEAVRLFQTGQTEAAEALFRHYAPQPLATVDVVGKGRAALVAAHVSTSDACSTATHTEVSAAHTDRTSSRPSRSGRSNRASRSSSTHNSRRSGRPSNSGRSSGAYSSGTSSGGYSWSSWSGRAGRAYRSCFSFITALK